jgi:hypothetical protein
VHKTVPDIRTAGLPTATLGAAYAAQLTATDGRAGTWEPGTEPLPDGLTITPSGRLEGVPATAGRLTFPVRFTDLWQQSVTRTVTLLVADGPPSINFGLLPDATANRRYSAQLTNSDGRAGVWSIGSGELPWGLSLSPAGRISGTPLLANHYDESQFAVKFIDGRGNEAVESFSIAVYAEDYWG